jgi:hypothetical protein
MSIISDIELGCWVKALTTQIFAQIDINEINIAQAQTKFS